MKSFNRKEILLPRLTFNILIVLLMILSFACSHYDINRQTVQIEKITFDLDRINDEGLTGPSDGLRSVSYEFCIPDSAELKSQVASIDKTVKFYESSPGRIGCGANQLLCIGSTHQTQFRDVLTALSSLDYIERIDECFFE